MRTAEQVVKAINSARGDGDEQGLRNTAALLDLLRAWPECPVIHVAGTNGKGSVCAMLSSVLTAAGYQEACYTKDGKYSYFTKWLTDGIDTKGRMPADTNKNKLTTLNELYKYIKKKGDSTPVSKSQARQHVQVYPAGCGFELFYRK